jgi:hypothetical protein
MSKRFGRNQKRKLMMQLEMQSIGVEMHLALVAEQRATIGMLRTTISDVAHILGPNFVGLPAVSRAVSELRDRYRMPTNMRMSDVMATLDDRDASSLMTMAVFDLENHRADGVLDQLRDCVHINLVHGSGKACYSISREALRRVDADQLARHYAPMIAREMAELVKRGF